MIIEDISQVNQDSSSSSSNAAFKFWGIIVLPGEPVAVTLPSNSFNCLHITQGTLEKSKSENKKNKKTSLISVKHEGQKELLICSCTRKSSDMMTSLELKFHGPTHMVFSAKGRRGVHLAGYLYNHNPSLPTAIMDDDGGRITKQKESVQSNNTHGVGTAGFNFNILLLGLAEYLKQIPVSIQQQLFEAQTEGSKKRRWKKANKPLPIVDKVDGENKGSEKKRKKKKEKKHLPEIKGADEEDNVEGEKKRKKKKEKKHKPEFDGAVEAKNVEGEKKRKKKRVLEVDGAAEGDVVEGEKKRKKKREKKRKPEVDGAEGYSTALVLY